MIQNSPSQQIFEIIQDETGQSFDSKEDIIQDLLK